MKKTIILALVLVLLVPCLTGCVRKVNKEQISEIIGIDITDCKFVKTHDDHDFFHGDGEFFAKVLCTDEAAKEITSKWEKLPLPTEITKFMETNNVYGTYGIPELKSGYYFLLDKRSKTADSDGNQVNEQEYSLSSFKVAIFDSLSKTMYLYEIDM